MTTDSKRATILAMPRTVILFPAVEPERFAILAAAAPALALINAASEDDALAHMPDASAFIGRISPPLLAAAQNLRWVQSPTASLEHYVFPELAGNDCLLTNMRGLFSDVIADHVLGYVLCF